MSALTRSPDAVRQQITEALDLDAFPLRGYRDREYLEAALDAGFEVTDLAVAHDVSKKSIYRAVEKHGIDLQQPPSNGLAKRLWDSDPDAIGGSP